MKMPRASQDTSFIHFNVSFGGSLATVSSTFGIGGGIFIGPFLKFMGKI